MELEFVQIWHEEYDIYIDAISGTYGVILGYPIIRQQQKKMHQFCPLPVGCVWGLSGPRSVPVGRVISSHSSRLYYMEHEITLAIPGVSV